MIYPTASKEKARAARLGPLESAMVQGRLKMWGRWSYIGGGHSGNIFNQLLKSGPLTRKSIEEVLQRLLRAGVSEAELETFLSEMASGRYKSPLAHCSDGEGLLVDRTIADALRGSPALIALLQERYCGRGKSKRAMAQALHLRHPEWSLPTCRNRIDAWLATAEYLLYRPLCAAFGVDPARLGGGEG